jgi:hypothetical protein
VQSINTKPSLKAVNPSSLPQERSISQSKSEIDNSTFMTGVKNLEGNNFQMGLI